MEPKIVVIEMPPPSSLLVDKSYEDRYSLMLAQIDEEPARAFKTTPVDRVGAILNYSTALTRDDVLEGLDEQDQDFANAVRRAIFTFANIPDRLEPLDVPKITRDVDQAVLVTAFAGATAPADRAAVDFILSNMSKRLAETLREEIADKGAVDTASAEEAMSQIIAAIRDMAANEEIALKTPKDE